MFDLTRSAIRLLAALFVAFAASAAAQGEEPGEMRLKLTTIMDPTGFEKPMPAARSILPADWTTTGGVIWRIGGECTNGQTVDWTATSPDGKSIIRMFPGVFWRYSNQGMPVPRDCIAKGYRDAEDFAHDFVSTQENARIVKVERDPATSQLLAQPPFSVEMPGDPYMRGWWDAAAVTFTYRYQNTDYTGVLILFTMHNHTVSGHSYGFGMPLEMGYGGAMVQTVFAAPTDQFDALAPVAMLFLKNYRPDPEWQARMNKHNAKLSADAIQAGKNISKIISSTYSGISDSSMASWRSRNESSDRSQRETSEWIRDVETYDADVPTGQVELPSGYDRAFQLNDDTFVVTNDAFYEPFRDSGIDGRELTVTR